MTAEQLALLIAGIVAPFIINLIKNWLHLSGRPALWMSFGFSVLIAVVSLLIVGQLQPIEWGDPVAAIGAVLKASAIVYALATLIYKQFLSKP